MNNYQSELIGMFIIKPALLDITIINENYFDKKHGNIFKALANCYKNNKAIVFEEITTNPNVDLELFVSCSRSAISTTQFEYYQDYAIKCYKKKLIVGYANKLSKGEIELEEFNKVYNRFSTLNVNKATRLDFKTLQGSLTSKKKKIKFDRFSTLEKKLNLRENDFVVLAGGTGVGKSAVALNLMEDLSKEYQCLYFNLEMVEEELYQRLISINSTYNCSVIERYENLPQNDLEKVNASIMDISKRKIDIINNSVTLDRLKSFIATYKTDGHFIVFIDHIGLIGTRAKTSYERMTEIAKELRKISLDYNCTIIGLCQLSRNATKETKPSLSMLRDSGEIEQSASKVVFVWEVDGEYSLVTEKNRSAPKSIIDIGYNKANQLIYELNSQRRDVRVGG